MQRIRATLVCMADRARRPGLTRDLLRGGLGNIAARLLYVPLAVALSAVLARSLGPAGYGVYAFVFALVSVSIVLSQFGLPKFLISETARGEAGHDHGHIRAIWLWSLALGLCTTAIVCLLALMLLFGVRSQFSGGVLATCLSGIAVLALMTFSRLLGCATRGLRGVVLGQLPDMIVRPGLLLLILVFFLWQGEGRLDPARAMQWHVVSAGIGLATAIMFLYYKCPAGLFRSSASRWRQREWLVAIRPFIWSSATYQVLQYADILIIGVFWSAADVGRYRVAMQAAMLGIIGLQAAQVLAQPHLARLYRQGDRQRLEQVVRATSVGAFLLALGVLVVLAVAGRELLFLVFGPNYEASYLPILILALGQLFNAFFGAADVLLEMTGQQKSAARAFLIGAVCNVALNLIFIPVWGIVGASWATMIGMVVWKLLLWHAAHRMLGMDTAAIRILR